MAQFNNVTINTNGATMGDSWIAPTV